MLLAIDISNTNIKFGLYNSATMSQHWVVSTARQRTADEYAMLLNDLLHHASHQFEDIDDIILSSVVPPLTPVFQELSLSYCHKEAIVLDLGRGRECGLLRHARPIAGVSPVRLG